MSSAEEALSLCAGELGDLIFAVPDGETGYRSNWVNFQAYFVHHPHPGLQTLQRSEPVGGVEQRTGSGICGTSACETGPRSSTTATLHCAEAARRS